MYNPRVRWLHSLFLHALTQDLNFGLLSKTTRTIKVTTVIHVHVCVLFQPAEATEPPSPMVPILENFSKPKSNHESVSSIITSTFFAAYIKGVVCLVYQKLKHINLPLNDLYLNFDWISLTNTHTGIDQGQGISGLFSMKESENFH